MRIHVTAFGIVVGLVWGLAILFVASANLVWPSYGSIFLELIASIYPGFHPGRGVGSVVIATLYGLVDGAIGGAMVACVYNWLERRFPSATGTA